MLKIPFGKHKETGLFYDAISVPNGLKCNCICKECGTALEAVHPKLTGRQNYFRHAANSNCKGGMESVFHLVAKQILKENTSLSISEEKVFPYNHCDIEISLHGKQPDAYIKNDTESLIVEIYFWHQIDQLTLDRYVAMNERVLEIDISGERKRLFDYQYLKELILWRAPREIYPKEPPKSRSEDRDGTSWWLFPFLVLGALLLFLSMGGEKGNGVVAGNSNLQLLANTRYQAKKDIEIMQPQYS